VATALGRAPTIPPSSNWNAHAEVGVPPPSRAQSKNFTCVAACNVRRSRRNPVETAPAPNITQRSVTSRRRRFEAFRDLRPFVHDVNRVKESIMKMHLVLAAAFAVWVHTQRFASSRGWRHLVGNWNRHRMCARFRRSRCRHSGP